MLIHKSRFWLYIIIAFVLGCCTRCTVSVEEKDRRVERREAPATVIPPEKAKEAAELYATVYKASIEKGRGGWAQEDAEKAVKAIFGRPSQ